MRKIIKRRIYDTETSKQLAFRYAGEYGDAGGYEERLYLTKNGLYFVYGVGGPDSPYPQETIKAIEKKEADEWETCEKKEEKAEKAKKPAKRAKGKDNKVKKARQPKAEKPAEAAGDTASVKDAEPAADEKA